jgi:hypothetical protein
LLVRWEGGGEEGEEGKDWKEGRDKPEGASAIEDTSAQDSFGNQGGKKRGVQRNVLDRRPNAPNDRREPLETDDQRRDQRPARAEHDDGFLLMDIAERTEEGNDVEVEGERLLGSSERMRFAKVAAETVDEGDAGGVSGGCRRVEVWEGEERGV